MYRFVFQIILLLNFVFSFDVFAYEPVRFMDVEIYESSADKVKSIFGANDNVIIYNYSENLCYVDKNGIKVIFEYIKSSDLNILNGIYLVSDSGYEPSKCVKTDLEIQKKFFVSLGAGINESNLRLKKNGYNFKKDDVFSTLDKKIFNLDSVVVFEKTDWVLNKDLPDKLKDTEELTSKDKSTEIIRVYVYLKNKKVIGVRVRQNYYE